MVAGRFVVWLGFLHLPLFLRHVKGTWEKCHYLSNKVTNATPIIQLKQKSQFAYFLLICTTILSRISTRMLSM